jgi:hypothetical protein
VRLSDQAEGLHEGFGVALLQDERLMRRIDAFAHQEYDSANPLDACPTCGTIQPGYRRCRRCSERIPRKRGIDNGFWIQEVVDEGHYQDVFQRIVALVSREQVGGVHVWVTATLVPSHDDSSTVRVAVVTDGPAEQVGLIPKEDAPAIRRACQQVSRTYRSIVACKGLINGGFMLDGGATATYGISLLLPPVSRFLGATAQCMPDENNGAK